MNATTLTVGQRYDVDATMDRWIGWTEGDGTGAEGYSVAAYFDGDGSYLGPDAHGIEPEFEAH